MDILIWKEIEQDFETAKKNLWCPKGVETWHREEEIGNYYLLKAYLNAKKEEVKDNLLFARILMSMYWENTHRQSEWYLLKTFIKPALDSYNKAIKLGEKPTEEELKRVKGIYDKLQYNMMKYRQDDCDLIALIDGLSDIPEFYFHDSEVHSFCVNGDNATMLLEFEGVFVEFTFYGVLEFNTNIDINNQYVCDYYCFQTYYAKELLIFILNCGYTIYCKKIKAKRVDKLD